MEGPHGNGDGAVIQRRLSRHHQSCTQRRGQPNRLLRLSRSHCPRHSRPSRLHPRKVPHHSLSLSLSLLFMFLFFYFYRQMLICLKYQLRIRIRTSLSLLCLPFLNNPGRPYNSCPLFMLLSSIYYFLSLILFFYQLPTHSLLLVKNHKIISITQ